MHKLTFYPLGNADCTLIGLDNGQKILFDYADMGDPSDDEDRRINLPSSLREDLEAQDKDFYDVVAFTHADDDHIHGFSEFFYLEHAAKYQDDDRIKINDLWVPAWVILESGLTGEARMLRTEARHRLINGKRIRVFSKPDALCEWLEDQGIDVKDREHLITGAGETVPGFSKSSEGVEFFIHAPFSDSIDGEQINRNDAALVMQATFEYTGCEIQFMLGSDINYEVWTDIVRVTRYRRREERLKWDVFHISHHCSYTALSDEKGERKTTPVPAVAWLYDQGNERGVLVSPSWPILSGYDDDQPPHRQAADYYKDVAKDIDGEFKVTMEHPTKAAPEPLTITLDCSGATVKKKLGGAAAVISSRPAPRAG